MSTGCQRSNFTLIMPTVTHISDIFGAFVTFMIHLRRIYSTYLLTYLLTVLHLPLPRFCLAVAVSRSIDLAEYCTECQSYTLRTFEGEQLFLKLKIIRIMPAINGRSQPSGWSYVSLIWFNLCWLKPP